MPVDAIGNWSWDDRGPKRAVCSSISDARTTRLDAVTRPGEACPRSHEAFRPTLGRIARLGRCYGWAGSIGWWGCRNSSVERGLRGEPE
jgi:hypothetical protein